MLLAPDIFIGKYLSIDWNDPLKLHKSEQAEQSVLRGVRVKKKIKALQFQLRKMLELHERSQTSKENSKSKPSIGKVIRRRKGEPDKWISYRLNR